MKIFISYLSQSRRLAGIIKKELDEVGFETFLAHEDIKATQIWMDSIYDHIKGSDIVLPLLTKGISQSFWCNQEIGVALAMNKLIIPIKIDINPVDFLSKYQALKYNRDAKFPIKKLYDIISTNKKLGNAFRNFKITVLGKSQDFFDSERNANLIASMNGYSKKQLEKIMKVSIENNQIYRGFSARRILKNLMHEYKGKVNQKLYDDFIKKLS